MQTVAIVLAALAALLHVYIFHLESIAWTGAGRRVFGTTREEAEATRELAYNQGFYNLFLAITTFVGIGFLVAGDEAVGAALVLTGTGSMLAAALVLGLSSRQRLRPAATQGTLPLLAVLALLADLVAG